MSWPIESSPLKVWCSSVQVWPVSAVCWLQEAASPGNGWSPPSSSSEHRVITLSEIRKNVNRVLLRYYALFRRADGRGARARPLLISRVPSNIFTASTHNYAELGVRSWSAGRGASVGIVYSSWAKVGYQHPNAFCSKKNLLPFGHFTIF